MARGRCRDGPAAPAPTMNDRALALLRFDFVLGGSDGAVGDALRGRFGDPVEETMWRDAGDAEHESLTFVANGADVLGLPAEFRSVTIRVRDVTDAVTEVLTFASIDERQLSVEGTSEGEGVDNERIRDWERRLGAVRSLLPGDEWGPETTVFWLDPGSVPDALATWPVDLAGADRSGSSDETPESLEPLGDRAAGDAVLLDDETLVLPRDPQQLWGTLLAIDREGHLASTVASGGRRVHGPWDDLATLYAVHYWCRARRETLDAFEERLEDAVAALPRAGAAGDPVVYDRSAATIHELREDWSALEARLDEERAALRRRLETASSRLDGRARPRADDDAGPDLRVDYVRQLDHELERTRTESKRVAARLDALAATLRSRLSIDSIRETVELQRRIGDGVTGGLEQGDRFRWFAAAVGVLVVVLATDAVMTGGLEAFVDRLFEAGLGAFTTQVVAGVLLLVAAVATVAYLRRRDDTRR